jgi:hypothetical protein
MVIGRQAQSPDVQMPEQQLPLLVHDCAVTVHWGELLPAGLLPRQPDTNNKMKRMFLTHPGVSARS